MSTIRLAFFKGKTTSVAAWAIRLWTCSRFNHVEVIMPDGRTLRADGDIGVIWSSIPAREAESWEVWSLPVTAEMLATIAEFAAEEVGCGYDWKGIFLAQFLPLRRQDKERWFCSELSAAVLHKIGVLTDRKAWSFSPGGLRKAVSRCAFFKRLGGVGPTI